VPELWTLGIMEHMENSSVKSLAIYLILATVSAVLILFGTFSLTLLGCALILLAEFFSWRRRSGWSFSFLASGVSLILSNELFEQHKPLLYQIAVAVVWLWLVISECRHFQKSRRASHAA
jgi:hypothetical protein